MTKPKSTKRQLITAFSGVAVLMMLLVLSAIWAWLAGKSPTVAGQSKASGPIAKMTTWVEPPPLPWPTFISIKYRMSGANIAPARLVFVPEDSVVVGGELLVEPGQYKLTMPAGANGPAVLTPSTPKPSGAAK